MLVGVGNEGGGQGTLVGAGEQRWEPGNKGGSWGTSVGAEEHRWEPVHIDGGWDIKVGARVCQWGQGTSVGVVGAWACVETTVGTSIT